MDHYVEVIGDSEYVEYPDKIMLDLDISVKAAKDESAERDIREIVNSTVNSLCKSGLDKEEIFFGGRETFTPWWKKNKAGVETRNRITIKSSDRYAVYTALEEMDRYKDDKRVTFTIRERQPIYVAKDEEVSVAMKLACENAFSKANCLAQACDRNVGKVLEIEEFKKGIRGSGSYGDYDYGDNDPFLALAAPAKASSLGEAEPASSLERNTRIVYLKYRVKYELL